MIKVSQLVEQYSPFFKIQFGIRNIPFTVLTNSVELDEMLRSYLNLWVNENTGEPGHVIYAIVGCIDIEYDKLVDIPRKANKTVKEASYDSDQGTVILKKRTGVVVVRTENARYVVGNLILHMNQVVNVIDEVYITDYLQNGYVLLHSSSVVDTGGNSVVFTSESGSGKSTMAVAMLEHGYHYLSNDRTLIKVENDRVIIVGVPKKPRLNPGTILALPRLTHILKPEEMEAYSRLSAEELWHLEDKHDLEVDEIYGVGTTVTDGRLTRCFFLNWKRNNGPLCIRKLSEDESLCLLLPNVINLDPLRKQTGISHDVECQLKEIIKRVNFYSVEGSTDIAGLAWSIANQDYQAGGFNLYAK